MDMLEAKNRHELFLEDRPVHTKGRADVSTLLRRGRNSRNRLRRRRPLPSRARWVEHCVIFPRRAGRGRGRAQNCIIMQDPVIGAGGALSNIFPI